MKNILFSLILILISSVSFCQTGNSKYNKTLADSLGADERGMKMYTFVILKTGTNTTEKKEVSDSLFAQHMSNIGRLAKEGKLIIAGPFEKNEKGYRGLFILNVKTKAEAAALLETDATIKAKILEPEIFEWYGSAALPMYKPFHDEVRSR